MATFEVVVRIAYEVQADTAKLAKEKIEDIRIPETLLKAGVRNDLTPYQKPTGTNKITA